MHINLNYLIDDSCIMQDADGNIIYGVLCESEGCAISLVPHKDYEGRSFSDYHTLRNSNFYNYVEVKKYGRMTDKFFSNVDRPVYNVFLEYRGDVYITAYENMPDGKEKVVMVKCADDVTVNLPDELRHNHNVRRFYEAKLMKEQRLK